MARAKGAAAGPLNVGGGSSGLRRPGSLTWSLVSLQCHCRGVSVSESNYRDRRTVAAEPLRVRSVLQAGPPPGLGPGLSMQGRCTGRMNN